MSAGCGPILQAFSAASGHSSSNNDYSAILQHTLNKRQHSLHGNTAMCLNDLIPIEVPRIITLMDHLPLKVDHYYQFSSQVPQQFSRDKLLQYRQVSQVPPLGVIKTTPLSQLNLGCPPSRTGKRRVCFTSDGRKIFFRYKPKSSKKTSIHEFDTIKGTKLTRRTPPPRGTPGAFKADEECPQKEGNKAQSRGAIRRSLRRRMYRKWLSFCKKHREKQVGTVDPFPSMPKKAALNNARACRQTVLWQNNIKRKRARKGSRKQTTPPLRYDSKLKVGALNVQGFADTLKLKTCLQIMGESNLDVLFLTETKSTSYYSYTSEEHLVILSGNNKDKHAGVGVIISPRIRPFLLDIVQVSTRIRREANFTL